MKMLVLLQIAAKQACIRAVYRAVDFPTFSCVDAGFEPKNMVWNMPDYFDCAALNDFLTRLCPLVCSGTVYEMVSEPSVSHTARCQFRNALPGLRSLQTHGDAIKHLRFVTCIVCRIILLLPIRRLKSFRVWRDS